MIYITCDIHHQSLQTENQKYSDRSEMRCAFDFYRMLKEKDMKATYFISGLSFEQDWGHHLEAISAYNRIELGGHNWDCFKNEFYHRVTNKLLGSYNGHYSFQKRDCERTQNIIYNKTGREITSWRNHMYMHGKYTDQVLSESGIKFCSDGVKKGEMKPNVSMKNYINLPINIIPDHEHIYHAERTPEAVEKWIKRYNWSDDFGSESYSMERWGEIMLDQVLKKEANNEDSLIIIHPITMYLADRYKFIEKFLDKISTIKTKTISEYQDA